MRGLLSRFSAPDDRLDDDDRREVVAELMDEAASRRYPAEPVRPWVLVGSRVVLWGAVAMGALGGLAGCLSRGGDEAPPPVAAEADPTLVPAQVASVAEIAVEQWLLATDEDAETLAALFVEAPTLPRDLALRDVLQVRTVVGQLVQDDYWSVTVAAEMVQLPEEDEDPDTDGDGVVDDEEAAGPEPYVWYVEVGVVGDPGKGLAVLRTPAVMPAPPAVDDGWSSNGERWESPDEEDELATTLDGFLDAVLTGEGNPGPYLASGADVSAVDPAPFVEVDVDELAVSELDDGRLRVQVRALALTETDVEQSLGYEVVMRWDSDRYEVLYLWGSSTLAGRPEPDDEASSPS